MRAIRFARVTLESQASIRFSKRAHRIEQFFPFASSEAGRPGDATQAVAKRLGFLAIGVFREGPSRFDVVQLIRTRYGAQRLRFEVADLSAFQLTRSTTNPFNVTGGPQTSLPARNGPHATQWELGRIGSGKGGKYVLERFGRCQCALVRGSKNEAGARHLSSKQCNGNHPRTRQTAKSLAKPRFSSAFAEWIDRFASFEPGPDIDGLCRDIAPRPEALGDHAFRRRSERGRFTPESRP